MDSVAPSSGQNVIHFHTNKNETNQKQKILSRFLVRTVTDKEQKKTCKQDTERQCGREKQK